MLLQRNIKILSFKDEEPAQIIQQTLEIVAEIEQKLLPDNLSKYC